MLWIRMSAPFSILTRPARANVEAAVRSCRMRDLARSEPSGDVLLEGHHATGRDAGGSSFKHEPASHESFSGRGRTEETSLQTFR